MEARLDIFLKLVLYFDLWNDFIHCDNIYLTSKKCSMHKIYRTGLSLRVSYQGFLPATTNVVPGYFHRKLEENRIERNP